MSKIIRTDESTVKINHSGNWRKGRELHGVIRPGQFWRKRDQGLLVYIVKKDGGSGRWRVDFLKGNAKSSHSVEERGIYKFYDKVD